MIFDDLNDRRIWVGWRREQRGGRPVKPPYNPRTGRLASSVNPNTWGIKADAEAWAERAAGRGIGVMFTRVDAYHLCGADFDTCRSGGIVAGWAQLIIDWFYTYAEVSPSRSGVKVYFLMTHADWLRALELPRRQFKRSGGDHPPGVEVYFDRRFFAVTENQHGSVDELRIISYAEIATIMASLERHSPGGSVGSGNGSGVSNDRSRSQLAWQLGRAWLKAHPGATRDEFRTAMLSPLRDPRIRAWMVEKGLPGDEYELMRIYDRRDRV